MVGGVPAPLLSPPSPSPAYRPLSPFPSRSLSPALPPLRAAGPAQVSREGAPGVRSGALGTGELRVRGGLKGRGCSGRAVHQACSTAHGTHRTHVMRAPALRCMQQPRTAHTCTVPTEQQRRHWSPIACTGSLQWESHVLWSPALQCTPTPCTGLALDASYPYDMRHTHMACTRTPLHAPNPPSMHQNPTGHISPILCAPAPHHMHWTFPACMPQTHICSMQSPVVPPSTMEHCRSWSCCAIEI